MLTRPLQRRTGTLGGAVAHGLPMVIFPISADQPENAARCAELGASRTLDQEHLTPEHVREVVLDVLHTPTYRQAAERLRDEFNALPGPEFAVELLERLNQVEERVRVLEKIVTDERYDLRQQFKDLGA